MEPKKITQHLVELAEHCCYEGGEFRPCAWVDPGPNDRMCWDGRTFLVMQPGGWELAELPEPPWELLPAGGE